MYSERVPFATIPHTSRLYLDYLYDFQRAGRYFPRQPYRREWFAAESSTLRYDLERRAKVSAVVERQNRQWGASESALRNLESFRAGAFAIVTGQQVTLFGGPLYSYLKAITAIKLAAEATAAGVATVPIFWLATEDHDLTEANHVYVRDGEASISKLESTSSTGEGRPVGEVPFGDEINDVVARAREIFGPTDAVQCLARFYRPGETFGNAFARWLVHAFAEFGLLVIDPSDPELHRLAAPVYRAAALGAPDLRAALQQRNKQLEDDGYHAQVMVASQQTLLFALEGDGDARRRVPIKQANGSFGFNGERLSADEFAARVAQHPERYSANALLRPSVQDFLLPTLAYVGGPAEIAYYAQAAVVFEELLGRVTPILPRISATLVDVRAHRLLEKYRLELSDVFHGEEPLKQTLANRIMAPEIHERFTAAEQKLEQVIESMRTPLADLDPTLADAAAKSGRKMMYQVSRLRERTARAIVRRNEVLARHAAELSSTLFPHKNLQERVLGGLQFLSANGMEVLSEIERKVSTDSPDHQIVKLGF